MVNGSYTYRAVGESGGGVKTGGGWRSGQVQEESGHYGHLIGRVRVSAVSDISMGP